MKEAGNTLDWCIEEMNQRFKLMASLGLKNITTFNSHMEQIQNTVEVDLISAPYNSIQKLSKIVVVCDEFVDLMRGIEEAENKITLLTH